MAGAPGGPPPAREVVRLQALLGSGAGAAPGRVSCAALGGQGGGAGDVGAGAAPPAATLWLGLEEGSVWEARLSASAAAPSRGGPAGAPLRLQGSADLGAGAVRALCALPGTRGGAAALAGGQLFRVDRGGDALPLRAGGTHWQRRATALALRREGAAAGAAAPSAREALLAAAFHCAPSLGRAKRSWLALLRLPGSSATRPGREEAAREVAGGGAEAELLQEAELEGIPEAVSAVVWQGQSVIIGTSSSFHVYSVDADRTSPIFQLPAGVASPARLWALPRSAEVALFMENVGTVVDRDGQPTGRTLLPPVPPTLLVGASAFLITIQGGNIVVHERQSDLKGGRIQGIPLHGFAEPGAEVDIVAGLEDEEGRFAVVCTPSVVLLVSPAPFEDQCRELLLGGRCAEALHLGDLGDAGGLAPWHQELRAEVGFMQLANLQFADALANLLSCPAVEPCELFPLFPQYTSKWLPQVPKKAYWGLHPPLVDLKSLLARGAGAAAAREDGEAARQEREAKRFVANYLHSSRQQRGGAPCRLVLPAGVDWLLLRLLDDLDDSELVERLCAGSNALDVNEASEMLEGAGRLHALALLLRAKGQQLKALDVWCDIGEARRRDSSLPAADAGTEPQRAADCALSTLRELSRDVEGSGAARASALRVFPWLLSHAPREALALLLGGGYPEADTVALLETHAGADVQWRYLHHAVVRSGVRDELLHTKLGLKMVEALRSSEYAPGEELDGVRSLLQSFLRSSDLYDTNILLDALAGADLAAEKVAVFTRRGEHENALRTLAVDVGDIEAAELYCSQHGGQESYMLLLEMLLNPQGGEPPRYDHAIRILSAREACIDPCQLLDTLPDNMPLPLAAGTIERILKERLHRKRLGQIERGLARARESSATAETVLVQRRAVTVTHETVCDVCTTRLGTKVFARYPNNVLACYRCYRKGSPNVCPVTGVAFSTTAAEGAP